MQAIIWNSFYMLESNSLVDRVAYMTDQEFNEMKKINSETPEKLEEAKFILFNKKRESDQLEDTVLYKNCELSR